jgi:hypothetical protein
MGRFSCAVSVVLSIHQGKRAGIGRWLDQTHDSSGRCRLKTIEITVTPEGKSRVETNAFAGNECREASRFLESALGNRTSETLTSEFYGNQTQHENQTQQET